MSTARVRCPVCHGDGIIDLRDQNALIAEHLGDAALACVQQTEAWKRPVRPCSECGGVGAVSLLRALKLEREARSAVQKALQMIDHTPKEGQHDNDSGQERRTDRDRGASQGRPDERRHRDRPDRP